MTRFQSAAIRLHAEGRVSTEVKDGILAAMPRTCLSCDLPFMSPSVAVRVCGRCKTPCDRSAA
jgi:hypothetical protein